MDKLHETAIKALLALERADTKGTTFPYASELRVLASAVMHQSAARSALILAEKALAAILPRGGDINGAISVRLCDLLDVRAAIQAALRNRGQGWTADDKQEAFALLEEMQGPNIDSEFWVTSMFSGEWRQRRDVLLARLRQSPSPIPGLSKSQPSPEEAPVPAGIQELIAGIESADKIVLDTDDHRVASVRCTAESVALIVAGLRLLASQPSAPTAADTGSEKLSADELAEIYATARDRFLHDNDGAQFSNHAAHLTGLRAVLAAAPSPPASVEQVGKIYDAAKAVADSWKRADETNGAEFKAGESRALLTALHATIYPVSPAQEETQ